MKTTYRRGDLIEVGLAGGHVIAGTYHEPRDECFVLLTPTGAVLVFEEHLAYVKIPGAEPKK